MNVTLFIARRYFISKKKRNFINFISGMSVVGVALGTMALIVVLSVFNGLEDLIRSIYGSFDPHLKITSVEGKSFILDSTTFNKITKIEGVNHAIEVVEDNTLVKYADKQTIVKMKGVSGEFSNHYQLKDYIIEGNPTLNKSGISYAIIGRGLQYKMGVDMQNNFYQLQFWYPKTEKKASLNYENSFNSANIFPGGIFALEKQYDDNYIFVPLKFAVDLMNYGNKRTALEINLKEGYDPEVVQSIVKAILGDNFKVLTRDEQHVSMLRAVKVEKLFVYITFSFIMAVSSLNIFFTLTMLAIEKKRDMNILFSIGATSRLVKRIFLTEGLIIAIIGAVSGLSMGYLICYMQQQYGLVSMGVETSLVNAYPVRMRLSDFVFTGIIIMSITFLISYQPANKASKIEGRLT
jgi:lipoprotein-releasing system permease protein